MNCDRARRALSERMDGERLSHHAARALEQHLTTCAACRAFQAGAYRLREKARIGLAPAVPDLVEPIMAAVRSEARPVARVRPLRAPEVRDPLLARLAPAIAAAIVGVLVGSLAVGGPWSAERHATAVDVTEGVARAAAGLQAYRASFQIRERNFAPDVPLRELSMEVWFHAPERYRVDVTDHTVYPSDTFTPTDLRLVVDGSTWYSRVPSPCPTTGCPPTETLITNRTPFSSAAPAPTDLVLPVTTLSGDEGVTVLGEGTLLGRRALRVEMRFDRAAPLFPFLRGGSWRPLFPDDRVVVWLDATSWFPLKWSVYPAPDPERHQWALRFGLPDEPPTVPVLEVEALAADRTAPPDSTFAVPRIGRRVDQGATSVPLEDVERRTGHRPVTPGDLNGLSLYEVVLPADPTGQAGDVLLTYSRGMQWLQVGESRTWERDELLGPVGRRAQEVILAGGGVAYYEPATEDQGRRLSIHTYDVDLYLETNLSRADLLRVAASLPVTGIPLPDAWRVREALGGTIERVPLEQARSEAPFDLLLPQALPEGSTLASVELVRRDHTVAVALHFQDEEVAFGGGEIHLYVELAEELPTAPASRQEAVQVRGVEARYTPDAGRLEWMEGGLYVSLEAPGLALGDLIAVAESLDPAGGPPGPTPSDAASPAEGATGPVGAETSP
ncbi:MAG TPA: zf-HC2 domain-containing protein [Actinomycetota bacterium]|nr:zf-HC2 domain-containing protein [Actinomycetota bacterium]